MADEYIVVIGEQTDRSIAKVVNRLFEQNDGFMSVDEFVQRLKDRFKFNPTEILSEQPQEFAERVKGCAYRVVDGRVYEYWGGD